ncbi:hypothetical protein AB833_16520 [Chromatiales bacterium (ex Bugula neritina AB1)]|nr:hypothetical protein AB833_16520 [Chromatiales bacterium (ex Bugula neritina AB1)]
MARSSDSFFLLALLKDKTFQAREIRRVIAFATLYLVITTALLGIFYNQMLGQLVSGTAPMLFVSEDMSMINEQIPSLSSVLGRWILIMLVVNVIVTSFISIYIVRKLGQPILAVKRALREIGEGKLNVRLRASDDQEFSEIFDAVESAVSSINEQVAAAKNEVQTARELQEQPTPDQAAISSSLSNCQQALDYFTTEDAAQKAA